MTVVIVISWILIHIMPSDFNFQMSVKNCFIRGSVVRYVQLPADECDTQLLQDAARKEAAQSKQRWKRLKESNRDLIFFADSYFGYDLRGIMQWNASEGTHTPQGRTTGVVVYELPLGGATSTTATGSFCWFVYTKNKFIDETLPLHYSELYMRGAISASLCSWHSLATGHS